MKTSNLYIVFALAALLSFASCGNKTKNNSTATSGTEVTDEETPEQVLEKVYTLVIDDYNTESLHPDISNLEEFVTKEYKDLQKKSDEKSAKLGTAGPVDWNVWINTQDYQGLKLLGIRKMKDCDGGVIMMVTTENCGSENDVYVKMTRDKGQWLISDFLYNWKDSLCSTADNMKEWLKEP